VPVTAPDDESAASHNVSNMSLRDVFISHASEDKDAVARPLADALKARGFSVWFDEQELVVGSRLSRNIDQGLATSRYGVVILSPAFVRKPWPQRELAGLVGREIGEDKELVLPIWHNVTAEEVRAFSPALADVLAVNTAAGLDVVVEAIASSVNRRKSQESTVGHSISAAELASAQSAESPATGVVTTGAHQVHAADSLVDAPSAQPAVNEDTSTHIHRGPDELRIEVLPTNTEAGREPKVLVRITDPDGDYMTSWKVTIEGPDGKTMSGQATWPGSGLVFRARFPAGHDRSGRWSGVANPHARRSGRRISIHSDFGLTTPGHSLKTGPLDRQTGPSRTPGGFLRFPSQAGAAPTINLTAAPTMSSALGGATPAAVCERSFRVDRALSPTSPRGRSATVALCAIGSALGREPRGGAGSSAGTRAKGSAADLLAWTRSSERRAVYPHGSLFFRRYFVGTGLRKS